MHTDDTRRSIARRRLSGGETGKRTLQRQLCPLGTSSPMPPRVCSILYSRHPDTLRNDRPVIKANFNRRPGTNTVHDGIKRSGNEGKDFSGRTIYRLISSWKISKRDSDWHEILAFGMRSRYAFHRPLAIPVILGGYISFDSRKLRIALDPSDTKTNRSTGRTE